MTQTGVVHGRFHIFHLDHLKYLLSAKARCKHLVVGITNPDPTLTKTDSADPGRSSPEANPLTYFERYTIVRAVLLEAGLEDSEFSVVPFPVNFPELYRFYLPLDATFYMTIYDDWGRRKLSMFESLGLKVEVLWTKPREQKGISAGDIRRRIAEGGMWESMVPRATAALIRSMEIESRLRETAGED
ncbi:MAG: nicotinate-nucleotide adenylyltransferase [Syntrophobacteraceae bacterium]